MIGDWAGYKVTRTQWDVVGYIKGSSYPNEPGTLDEAKRGANYVVGNVSGPYTFYSSNSYFGWTKVENYINSKNRPLIAGLIYRNSSNQIIGAHRIAISGSDPSYNKVCYVDPDTGSTYWCYFSDLLNGKQRGGAKFETTIYYD